MVGFGFSDTEIRFKYRFFRLLLENDLSKPERVVIVATQAIRFSRQYYRRLTLRKRCTK